MTTANVPYDLDRFLASVLNGMGWEATPWRMNLMREWAAGEGTGAGYNPLATTQQGGEDPSDPYWNDNGGNPVKNYRDFETGVAQTIATLSNQYYPALRATLETETIQPGAAENAATWGTMHLANWLRNGGGGGVGEGYTGPTMNPEVDLPFSQEEYDQKLARYIYLETYLSGIDPNFPPADYDQLLTEYSQVAADIMRFDQAKEQGGADWDQELARLDYLNASDPRRIDAENAANRWAREQTLNQQAMADTQTEMAQQRLSQDSAEVSGNNFKSQSVFSGPMSFRVASTDLPTEEEVFADSIAKASRNLPEVPDLPYAAPLPSAFGKAPSYTAPTPQPNGNGASIFDSTRPSNIRDSLASQFNRATMADKTAGFLDRTFGSGFGQDSRPPLFSAPNLITNNNVAQTATPVPTPRPSVFSGPPVATRTPTPYNQPQSGLYGSARRFVGSLFGGFR